MTKTHIERVTSSRSPSFAEAYRALDAEFGEKGELERREVLERWLDEGDRRDHPASPHRYHLLVARNERGELAAVRDCHVLIEPATHTLVVYLAHVLVLPPYRRTGLAHELREEPVRLGERALLDGRFEGFDRLLAAEMEPPDAEDRATLIRLVAYGKEGYWAISPEALSYFQPDFRARVGEAPRPVPLLAVVRWVGHERSSSLPKRLARAFVRQLYAAFATHVPREHLVPLEQSILSRLDAFPESEVPLLALPRSLDDQPAILRLTHARAHAALGRPT